MPTLNVKVVPGAKEDRIAGRYADGVKVRVRVPPEGGKANAAVIALLADALGVKRAQVRVVSGHAQPRKVINIEGLDSQQLTAWLAAFPD